jgi:hypothetical protein
MLALIVYFIFVFSGLFYVIKSKNKSFALINVYAFSIPFFGLMYDMGISLTILQNAGIKYQKLYNLFGYLPFGRIKKLSFLSLAMPLSYYLLFRSLFTIRSP